jgi:Kef-type K+ transport system membrane component KefB
MAITAFPVLARLLAERHMLRTSIGTLALTCAAIDDVIGWCLLALVIALINAAGLGSVAITIGLLALFVGVMLGVVRPLLLLADRRIQSKPVLMAITVVLLLLSAYVTNAMGIHPVFGAFMMGIVLPRRTAFIEQVQSIDSVNNLLFLPIYFVYNGLRTHIGLINSPTLWLICGLVLMVACLSKILGGALSLKVLGEPWKESFALGTLMNTRGLVVDRAQHWAGSGGDFTNVFRDAGNYGCGNNDDGAAAAAFAWIRAKGSTSERVVGR